MQLKSKSPSRKQTQRQLRPEQYLSHFFNLGLRILIFYIRSRPGYSFSTHAVDHDNYFLYMLWTRIPFSVYAVDQEIHFLYISNRPRYSFSLYAVDQNTIFCIRSRPGYSFSIFAVDQDIHFLYMQQTRILIFYIRSRPG